MLRQKNDVENANQTEIVYQVSAIIGFPVNYHLDSVITNVLYANLLIFFPDHCI